MHETSDPNGSAMAAYASAARTPYANSISTDFAKLIPNSTDVVFYKPTGWTLLNYAWLGNRRVTTRPATGSKSLIAPRSAKWAQRCSVPPAR